MAAPTITSSPGLIQPAYNELIYVVTPAGANYTNAGYAVQAKVYSSSSVLITTLNLKAHPNDGTGAANKVVFDAHRIIETLVSYDYTQGTYGEVTCPNSFIGYYVTFQEGWTVSGAFALDPGITIGSTNYAFNGSLSWYDFSGYNWATWGNILDNSVGTYLTKLNTFNIQLNQCFSLYYLLQSTNVDSFKFVVTDANGSASTYTLSLGSPAKPGMFRLTCGTYELNQLGIGTVITASSASYTVQAYHSTTPLGAAVTFTILPACRYTNVRLQFLNKYGGFDGFNFTLVNKETYEVSKKSYQKVYGAVTAGTWGYKPTDLTQVDFNTETRRRFHLTSDWLNDAQIDWLKDLMSSPVVFQELTGTTARAVNIIDNRYAINKKEFEPVYNLEIDIMYSEINQRQRQ